WLRPPHSGHLSSSLALLGISIRGRRYGRRLRNRLSALSDDFAAAKRLEQTSGLGHRESGFVGLAEVAVQVAEHDEPPRGCAMIASDVPRFGQRVGQHPPCRFVVTGGGEHTRDRERDSYPSRSVLGLAEAGQRLPQQRQPVRKVFLGGGEHAEVAESQADL